MRVGFSNDGLHPLLALVASLGLAAAGCGLDKTPNPPLNGPSETGVSAELTATPYILNADGVSESVVQLVLRDPSGAPLVGRAVLFQFSGDGTLVPSTASTYVGPVQTGIVMATGKDGTAYVVYVAGTGLGTVTVSVSPYGNDVRTIFFQSVDIIQQ
jgi:hypothetical protein